MTRFLFSILMILILWCPTSSIAGTLNSIHIEENDKGVTLQVDGAPLGEVLQSIEDKTGIQFHVSPSVINDRITVHLNAPDWQTAMKWLLEPYGRAELWNPRLDLTEIHILSGGMPRRLVLVGPQRVLRSPKRIGGPLPS